MTQTLALYRRYRPETFAEVIGQDHVTGPLRQALANNRVNHAYLFSGPRGCGKTTSARILARALNCEKAPIADPCGECQSCRDLARGGPGSIDVIEIDAASHGGVDDARDLRERAFFAPVSSRYKIYIIDEAHMVSSQGFNALLKLVEEPPEHLKFIFATTEPEKVIPTIRSRTHHYPFRLIPPRLLQDYLAELCAKEGVAIDPAALPLVVRAGAGSARDTLSVLDQLLGGAGTEGVTYDVATNLLGYTPDNLLDEVVDGLAASDGASVFGVVDKVMETGQDPRRFTEDLLRRLRDLVIVSAVPDAPASGLLDLPEDAAERLTAQAARFGRAELVRAADIVSVGLTEMRGATSPRLLLELICARVLLPASSLDAVGLAARMDRFERRLGMGGAPEVEEARSAVTKPEEAAPPTPPPAPEPEPEQRSVRPAAREAARNVVGVAKTAVSAVVGEVQSAVAKPGTMTLADARRIWPDLLDEIKKQRRFAWILLSQNAQVVGLEGDVLTLGLKNSGARESFLGSQSDEVVAEAALRLVGSKWRVEAIVDGSEGAPRTPEVEEARSAVTKPEPAPAPEGLDTPAAPALDQRDEPAPKPASTGAAAAREQLNQAAQAKDTGRAVPDADEHVDLDDPVVDDGNVDGQALLEQTLGATVIDEITHEQ
ncbi:MAG: DNA polymerase III subunit gamma and tau [Marmoricola sp.]